MSEALSEGERRDWLKLSRTENVGPVTFDQLLQRFGTAGKALAALPDLARRGGRAAGLKLATDAQVDKELAAMKAQLAISPAPPELPSGSPPATAPTSGS